MKIVGHVGWQIHLVFLNHNVIILSDLTTTLAGLYGLRNLVEKHKGTTIAILLFATRYDSKIRTDMEKKFACGILFDIAVDLHLSQWERTDCELCWESSKPIAPAYLLI
jgi:hypothetical protein